MASFLEVVEAIMMPSPAVFIIGILIVVLVPVLLHFVVVRSSPYVTLPTVLLVGPSGAGKTSLLTLFERGDTPSVTRTTQIPTSVEFTASGDGKRSFREQADTSGTHTKFLLVDTPGHGKLRPYALTKVTSTSVESKLKAVVFVVDAAGLGGEGEMVAPTAAYLYDLLLALQKRASTTKTTKVAIPVLIAANKRDLFTALPAPLVKSTLEEELTRIRSSRSKGLLDSGTNTNDIGAEEHDDWLGEYGSKEFSFEQMGEFDIEIEVLDGTVTGGDGAPSVDRWWEWITEKI